MAIRKPKYFKVKKFLFLATILVSIALLAAFVVMVALEVNQEKILETTKGIQTKFNPTDKNLTKTEKRVFIILFVVFGLLQVFGLIGVICENFCLIFCYVIIQLFAAVTDLIQVAFYGKMMIGEAVWSLLVSFISLLFLRDIYMIHQQKMAERKATGEGEAGPGKVNIRL